MGHFGGKKKVEMVELQQFKSLESKVSRLKFWR